jgi:hypothetical protein
MNGYEKLNSRQADFLWEGWRERKIPEEELDDTFLDRLDKSVGLSTPESEPCDLYDRCRDCPNLTDCFNLPIQELSSKVT